AAFCQVDTLERETSTLVAPRRVRVAHSPGTWRVLLWLPLRQGWVLLLVLLGIALLAGLALPLAGVLYWSSFTLVVGVMCGVSVFGSEQSEGSNHFLGNQRFPMGKVWAIKTGFWFVAALVILGAFVGSGLLSAVLFQEPGKKGFAATFAGSSFLTTENAHVFLPLGLLLGFSIGQYYGLLWRKTVVAVVMALVIAPGLAAIWLPSLVFGGVHFGQVFVPVVALLLGTRLVAWAWCSTGLGIRQSVLTLVACGTFAGLWMAGALCYRFWEVPRPGEPLDAEAFVKSMPTIDTSEAGTRMRTAGQEFKERFGYTSQLPRQILVQGPVSQESTTPYVDTLARAFKNGWPREDQELDNWLDEVFTRIQGKEKSWAELYAEAAAMPLGVVDEPLTSPREAPMARRALDAGTFLEARAMQLQARHMDEAALDQIGLILALSRQLRNYAMTRSYSYGRQLEAKGMDALDRWLAERRSPELLRRALATLEEHEGQIPPVALSVKSEHARMNYLLERGELFQNASGQVSAEAELVAVLEFAPWEKLRHLRILDALTEAGLRVSELEPRAAAALLDSVESPPDDPQELAAIRRGLTLLDEGDTRSAAKRWAQLLSRNRVASLYRIESLEQRVTEGLAQSRRRAARLKIALLLYREQHRGQLPPDLHALVTEKILASAPLDPFDGKPIRYRVSDGQDVNWSAVDGARKAPACAVLWSVGPDGGDNGGRNAGEWDSKSSARRW
ncbi:MAG TPA: hypothetical protein VKE94_14995, partial [Gemmataceae bacterium]|nr:hypothetical protein [Gemmataceae bacterium]